MNWGYGGSGPADLARSILVDHFGHVPHPLIYRAFKWKFVAGWGDEWQITSGEIGAWMTENVDKWKEQLNVDDPLQEKPL